MRQPRKIKPSAEPALTNDQALELAYEFARLDAAVTMTEADREAAIAATNATADAVVLPQIARMKTIAKQLEPWWKTAGADLTGGERKSIEFGGCHIGERTTTPKLAHSYATDGDAVDALLKHRLRRLLVRTRYSLDKPILLRLLGIRDKLSSRLVELGFRVSQKDEFFVQRLANHAARPENAA